MNIHKDSTCVKLIADELAYSVGAKSAGTYVAITSKAATLFVLQRYEKIHEEAEQIIKKSKFKDFKIGDVVRVLNDMNHLEDGIVSSIDLVSRTIGIGFSSGYGNVYPYDHLKLLYRPDSRAEFVFLDKTTRVRR